MVLGGKGVSPVILSQEGTVWSAARLNIPSNGESHGADNSVNSITCPTQSACVVGGSYDTPKGVEGFFDDITNGMSSKSTEAKLPNVASIHQDDHGETGLLGIHAIACLTLAKCVAGGAFISSDDKVRDSYSAVTYARSGRIWEAGLAPGLPSGSASPSQQYSNVVGVSYLPSHCMLIGTFYEAHLFESFSAMPAALPSAPAIRKITIQVGAMTLSLRPPSATGGLPIVGYQYSVDGGTTWRSSSSGALTTITVTHLARHHAYHLSVRAVTEEGHSVGSRAVVAATR